MSPLPPVRYGVLRIPAPAAVQAAVRFAPIDARDCFDPSAWRTVPLSPAAGFPGHWDVDLDALSLPDGEYEYEFVVDGLAVADPFADEITRFGGYRGIFRIRSGQRERLPFRWDDELPAGRRLPQNNEIVIYEMPVRWMSDAGETYRQVDLGTFDEVIFERLDMLAGLGVNAIELLPVQDSPDTLNWGYGTRFFFAPDFDMGGPQDLKLFIKRCHQRGIRVILDVVMNHSKKNPIEQLAFDWYYLRSGDEEGGRNGWGGQLFRYREPSDGARFPAREFHCQMAEFWIREYRVDGFRLDEFAGINNWDFVQQFRERAWAAQQSTFPGRPFLVIAEDSGRRFGATRDAGGNPNGRKVTDAIWNFAFQDEGRRLVTNQLRTTFGRPSRRERIRALLSGSGMWEEMDQSFREGYTDLAQSVNYFTSHDVEQDSAQRLMNAIFGALLSLRGLGAGGFSGVRDAIDGLDQAPRAVRDAHAEALDRIRSAFALLLTAVGIPMFLAGEEFADVHDLDNRDWRLKMSDPVDWRRASIPAHAALLRQVRELIRLRTSHPALQRNEITFLYEHPLLDENFGPRVFAYCRGAGKPPGATGQVAVVANCGSESFAEFWLPWPWSTSVEAGAPEGGGSIFQDPAQARINVPLAPFQVRVFLVS